MTRIIVIITLLLTFIPLPGVDPADAGHWSDFKEKVKSVYSRFSNSAKKSGDELKKSSSTFGREISKAARKTGESIKEDTQSLGHSISEGAQKTGNDIEEAFNKARKKFQ